MPILHHSVTNPPKLIQFGDRTGLIERRWETPFLFQRKRQRPNRPALPNHRRLKDTLDVHPCRQKSFNPVGVWCWRLSAGNRWVANE